MRVGRTIIAMFMEKHIATVHFVILNPLAFMCFLSCEIFAMVSLCLVVSEASPAIIELGSGLLHVSIYMSMNFVIIIRNHNLIPVFFALF